jgi:hypothetical protein
MEELGFPNFSPNFSPNFNLSRNLNTSDSQYQLYIHLPNHGFRVVKIDETAADVSSIVNCLVSSMSGSSGTKPNCKYYSLRLRHMISKEIIWIPTSEYIITYTTFTEKLNFSRHTNATSH